MSEGSVDGFEQSRDACGLTDEDEQKVREAISEHNRRGLPELKRLESLPLAAGGATEEKSDG